MGDDLLSAVLDRLDVLEAANRWLRADRHVLFDALDLLVGLKDGPRDAAYEEAKPQAWQVARDVLAAAREQGDTPAERTKRWCCLRDIAEESCTPEAPHGRPDCCWVWTDTATPCPPPAPSAPVLPEPDGEWKPAHPWLDRYPTTLGEAMRLIGRFTESEGGNSAETRQARADLFDAYEGWCYWERPEHELTDAQRERFEAAAERGLVARRAALAASSPGVEAEPERASDVPVPTPADEGDA